MNKDKLQNTSLLDMAGGAIKERVNYELTKIIENITDPNTSATKPRTLTVQIKLLPDSERKNISIDTIVKSKIEPTNAISTPLYLTEDSEGQRVAVEMTPQIPGQMNIDGTEQSKPNIILLDTKKAM